MCFQDDILGRPRSFAMLVDHSVLCLHQSMLIPKSATANGLAEAEELADLAKKQGVKTLVGLQARQSPVILKAKEIIDSGALGRITNTSLVCSTSMLYEISPKVTYVNDTTSGKPNYLHSSLLLS